jgi:hypothetical protein
MSVRLKSRTECPPGGFIVTIAALNLTRNFWSLREAVTWFGDIARDNPFLKLPTDPVIIANFIDQQNALRCLGISGADSYVIQEGGPIQNLETKKASLLKPLVAVADKLRQLAAGTVLLEEWGAEGFPTEPPAASARRAAICAGGPGGSPCPQNGLGDLTRWFTVFASEGIRRRIEAAQKLDLKTPSDSQLGICEACLCPLRLKVHVPLANIQKHLTPASQAALDPRCWILTQPKP